MSTSRLQTGIYFGAKTTPHPSYRLLLLNASARASSAAVARGLERLMGMFEELRRGRVPELNGERESQRDASAKQFEGLDALIGYGRRLFDTSKHRPRLTTAERPDFLAYLASDGPFPALRWASRRRSAEADFALQLTASSEAAVSLAAVEAWKLIADEGLPLLVAESFSGFGRTDGRGWLSFHDGVSNMPSDQRPHALVAAADPPWMEGGTYMAYLRLLVELARWRDPPQTSDPVLEASHIARANQSRASPVAPGAFRIYRQGYDFLESLTEEGVQVGLNFVSFQRDLRVLQQLLHLPEWLGDANFGGAAGAGGVPALISLAAGGLYAVPPRADPYAGADLFVGNA